MKYFSKAKIQDLIKDYRESLEFFLVCMVILVSASITGNILYSNFFSQDSSTGDVSSYDTSDENASTTDSECNVKGINIHGEIYTYNSPDSYNDQERLAFDQTSADNVVWYVRDAQTQDNIKAIIVEIDSPGGSGVAGEEVMRRARSSAYLAASGAQTVFASKFSDVGSIGVTMSYLQNTEKNKKAGLEYISLSSGKYKDSGSPDRVLTADEKEIFMRDIKVGYEYFVSLVSQNRKLDIEKVKRLADGSSMMGEAALKEGLIDKVGLLPDAEKFISEKIGEEANICW
jgi:protease-4